MTADLYDLYSTYSREQLFNVVVNNTKYHPIAIDVARKIIEEKNWTTDFFKYLEDNKLEVQENPENHSTEYHKDLVDFKNNQKYFDIKLDDVVKFEKKLIESKIEFYKEKELFTVMNSKEPIQAYLFRTEDVEKVEQIVVELDILLKSTHYKSGLYKFEIATILILLVALMLIMFSQ